MPRLLQHRLDPQSRLVRLMCAEYGVPLDLEESKPWLREPRCSSSIRRPAGRSSSRGPSRPSWASSPSSTPSRTAGRRAPWRACFRRSRAERAEMWRLLEWVLIKLNDEVTRYVFEEKIVKRDRRGATPEPGVLRVAKANLTEHLLYFNWLFATRQWIAGDVMTLADFALAAHLSTLDYTRRRRLGHLARNPPVVRPHQIPPGLPHPAERPRGRMPAAAGYADLDF
jgi:glutathione S-transferase